MEADIDSADSFRTAGSSAIRVTIIYEDFATGTLAKHFAERLAESLECICPLSETIWRSELLELPPVADQAADAVANCDYLIVSIHGDHVPPHPTRRWIETQLDSAAERGMALILISDPSQGKWRVAKAIRHYFRCACAAKDVAFFSDWVNSPEESVAAASGREDEAVGLELWERRSLPLLPCA